MAKSSSNSAEYNNCSKALYKVLYVSHAELKTKLAEEKKRNKRKPKRPPLPAILPFDSEWFLLRLASDLSES